MLRCADKRDERDDGNEDDERAETRLHLEDILAPHEEQRRDKQERERQDVSAEPESQVIEAGNRSGNGRRSGGDDRNEGANREDGECDARDVAA